MTPKEEKMNAEEVPPEPDTNPPPKPPKPRPEDEESEPPIEPEEEGEEEEEEEYEVVEMPEPRAPRAPRASTPSKVRAPDEIEARRQLAFEALTYSKGKLNSGLRYLVDNYGDSDPYDRRPPTIKELAGQIAPWRKWKMTDPQAYKETLANVRAIMPEPDEGEPEDTKGKGKAPAKENPEADLEMIKKMMAEPKWMQSYRLYKQAKDEGDMELAAFAFQSLKALLEKELAGGGMESIDQVTKIMEAMSPFMESKNQGQLPDQVLLTNALGGQILMGMDRISTTVESIWGRRGLKGKGQQQKPQMIYVQCRQCASVTPGYANAPPPACQNCGMRFAQFQNQQGQVVPLGAQPEAPAQDESYPAPQGGHRARPPAAAPRMEECHIDLGGVGWDGRDEECQNCYFMQDCMHKTMQRAKDREKVEAMRIQTPAPAPGSSSPEPAPATSLPKDIPLTEDVINAYDTLHRIAEWIDSDTADQFVGRLTGLYNMAVNRKLKKVVNKDALEGIKGMLLMNEMGLDRTIAMASGLDFPSLNEFSADTYGDTPQDVREIFISEKGRNYLTVALGKFTALAKEDGITVTAEDRQKYVTRMKQLFPSLDLSDLLVPREASEAPRIDVERKAPPKEIEIKPQPSRAPPAPEPANQEYKTIDCEACIGEGRKTITLRVRADHVEEDLKAHLFRDHPPPTPPATGGGDRR